MTKDKEINKEGKEFITNHQIPSKDKEIEVDYFKDSDPMIMKAERRPQSVPPKCLRCHRNRVRYDGVTQNIPFTQPNRFFNPDIYVAIIPNIACKECMDELRRIFITWWKGEPK